jgi:RNA polymerase sigma-70 factor (ECF subfamily)
MPAAARSGAVDDFGRLYGRYAGRIFRWIAMETQSSEIAADLTAETFAAAFLSRGSFRGNEPADELAWIFGIARNLVWKHRRSARVESRARARLGLSLRLDHEVFDEVDARLAAESERDALATALDGLPAGQQEIVRRIVLDGQTPSEAAKALGLRAPAVRMRLTRALRSLRAQLHERKAL